MNDRITQAEKELRIYQVYQMVLSGFPRYKIIEYGKGTWKACERSIDGYISDVASLMNNINIENHKYNLNLMNARLEDMINKCYAEHDKKTMVQLLRLQSDILGLNKQKIDVTSNGKDLFSGIDISITYTDKNKSGDEA